MKKEKTPEKLALISRVNKARRAFDEAVFYLRIVNKDFQKKEDYTYINGNHPKEGTGFDASDIVFEQSELTEGKVLVCERLKEGARRYMPYLKGHNTTLFVF